MLIISNMVFKSMRLIHLERGFYFSDFKISKMDNALQIFSEKSRYGVKDEKGKIIIAPEYMEMQPFSCGVSLVRNFKHQYAYINRWNQPIIPFGKYTWCDPQFVCGYARVIEYQAIHKAEKFGIIDTLGNIIVPIKYDQIWVLNEHYFSKIKAFIGDKLDFINLFELTKHTILDGLKYIQTYSVADFKRLVHCSVLSVRRNPLTNHLYFVYGCNFGLVATHGIPKDPVVSIVANSQGKIFPLLTEKKDVGLVLLQSLIAYRLRKKFQIKSLKDIKSMMKMMIEMTGVIPMAMSRIIM